MFLKALQSSNDRLFVFHKVKSEMNCFDFDLIDESGNVISDKSGVNSLGEINTGTAFN